MFLWQELEERARGCFELYICRECSFGRGLQFDPLNKT